MEAFVGTITLFGGNFNPRGWALCQGQIMNISQNTALYSILGTSFGGNGQNTFALPDLRNRVPVGAGGLYQVGETGGSATSAASGAGVASGSITLTTAQLPAHNHPATTSIAIPIFSEEGGTNTPGPTAILATATAGTNIYAENAAPDNSLMPFSPAITVDNTGCGQPIPIALPVSLSGITVPTLPPFLGMNYIICLQGIFPSRD